MEPNDNVFGVVEIQIRFSDHDCEDIKIPFSTACFKTYSLGSSKIGIDFCRSRRIAGDFAPSFAAE